MNIAEAVEIVRSGGTDCEREDAYATLAYEYLHYFDPTPLTVELIEQELGPAIRVDGWLHYWKVNGREFAFDGDAIVVNLYTFFLHATLGDLRSIVRMLRKGGAFSQPHSRPSVIADAGVRGGEVMKAHRHRIDSASIEWANMTAKDRIDYARRLVNAFDNDPNRDERLEHSECVICFGASRIGGATCTSRQCGLCDCIVRSGNTNVDVLCIACAKGNGLCKHCGADIDLKNRRKRVIPSPTICIDDETM